MTTDGDNVGAEHPFPSPGSRLAYGLGCSCPVIPNEMGNGNAQLSEKHLGRRWVYGVGCEMHPIAEGQRVAGIDGEPTWLVLIGKREEPD